MKIPVSKATKRAIARSVFRSEQEEAAQIKAMSLKMCDHLPDDPRMAVTVAALNFAHVTVATGCDDESAIEAFKRALKQMRQGQWWLDA